MKKVLIFSILSVILFSVIPAIAMDEGTRHITGSGLDVFFMNDKVFGTSSGHPLWAIYNCGTDINGEIDVSGTYKTFSFVYNKEGEKKITGKFADKEMGLTTIEKKDGKVFYTVYIGDKTYIFSIRFEKIEDDHMINSFIEGELDEGKKITLTVDGPLCPFATTGIILITAGTMTVL